MVQRKSFDLYLARTAGMLSGARRVAMTFSRATSCSEEPMRASLFSRSIGALLLAVMLLTMTAQTAWAWSGGGTEDNPYLIQNANDLNELSTLSQTNDFDGVYFQLYNDITFDNTQSNNFVPIASGSNYFQGIFDGNGKTISGVRISTTNTYQGLFASVGANGVVKKLKVADTEISAYNMSGIIASYCEGAIMDCSVGSDVTLHAINPNGSQYGSIAGLVRGGHVSNCSSAATITLSIADGDYHAMGGLVGELNGNIIEKSVFTGSLQISTLSTSDNCFAVLGKLTDGTVTNCYYTDESLTGGYSGVSLACTVTAPSQFTITTLDGAVSIDGKSYILPGTEFFVNSAEYPTSELSCIFDVIKTSNNSSVSSDVIDQYSMPNYNITLIFKHILPYFDPSENSYRINDEGTWNAVADEVADGRWDFSGETLNMAHDITVSKPIGTSEHPFKGTFDGKDTNGIIQQITFNATATGDYCAPFGHINNATLKNLKVTGTINTAYQYSSGLVGKAVSSTIQDCLSAVTINATLNGAGYHGSLIGYSSIISMSDCVFAGSLQGSNTTHWSGMIGFDALQTDLTNCLFAPASVNVNTTGCNQFGYKDPNCVWQESLLTLTNCYYTTVLGTGQGGTLAYTATLPEAIVPTDASAGIFYNSKLYVGSTQTAILKYLATAGGAGVTLLAMTAKDELNATVTVTKIDDNTYSINMPAKNITVSGTMTDLWGLAGGADGTENHPYIITTTAGLDLLATQVNGGTDYANTYFKLGDDITYTYASGDTWDLESSTTNNFTTIGTGTKKFKGHFDGDNHTIRGIRINSGDRSVGLFGNLYTNDAEIKNVILDDARITSSSYYVGGILGYTGDDAAQSKVTNCHVKNVLVKGDYEVGGVVGGNNRGTVSDCTSGATVTCPKYLIGGVVGWNHGTLKNSFYYGSGVTAGDHYSSSAGAITVNDGGTLQNNYYLPCPVKMKKDSYTTYTTNNGVGKPCKEEGYSPIIRTRYSPEDVSTNDGGLAVYALTLAAVTNGSIAAATKTITHNSTDYYKAGATVTVTATPNEGYSVASVTYNDGSSHAVDPVSDVYSFTMPATAVTVSSAFSENAFSLAYDSNNDAVLTTWNGKTAKVTLAGRTLKKDGSWNTLCLPFDVTIASSPLAGDGVTAKVFSSSSHLTDGTLHLDFIKAPATIPAGTPFIVKWTGGSNISNPKFTGVTVNSAAPVAATSVDGNVTFAGTYSPFDPTTGLMFDALNTSNGACHVALSTTEPTRVGYTLTGGWNTEDDGSGADVTTIPFDRDIYAKGNADVQYGCLTIKNDGTKRMAVIDGNYSEEEELNLDEDISINEVTINRTFPTGINSTIIFPFEINTSMLTGVDLIATFKDVYFDDVNNVWTVDMEEVWSANDHIVDLNAYTPYLVKMNSATLGITGSVTFKKTELKECKSGNWTFRGTTKKLTYGDNLTGSIYGLAGAAYDGGSYTVKPGDFVKAETGAYVLPLRCYLTYSEASSARGVTRGADIELPSHLIVRLVGKNGLPTAIGSMDTKTGEVVFGDEWYSLDGRRLSGKPNAKGLYINNGKKVVIK